ncbi:unnamed protein product [Meganyctiphanes norvegica]|uniref:Peptidase S1 domain-containing protein n=1 Tax=Meganyctiphanes norvegica TaxID=48144 RepID=A0AAV2Q9N6_MEGNR
MLGKRAVVATASMLMMLIWPSESKPQNVDTSHISDTALIDAFGVGSGSKCNCVPLTSCCDKRPGDTTQKPGTNSAGVPILQGLVDDRTIVGPPISINIGDRQNSPNAQCSDLLTVCCAKECPKLTQTPGTQDPGPAQPPGPAPQPRGCGTTNPDGVGVRVIGFTAQQAQLGEFPWMVAVLDKTNKYVAGASLLHPRIVLTAAHKVHTQVASNLIARIGDWDISATTEPIPPQNINVAKVLTHTGFDRTTLVNDVALLVLQSDAVLGKTVMPICLPEPRQTFDGADCIVTGWGKDVFGKTGQFQKILKKVTVPAVNHNQCQTQLRSTRLGSTFTLHDTFNCAGGNGEDACDGDGGSPLICPNPRNPAEYVQMGVVAWGIGCGKVGNPGVYGSIPATADWITSTIDQEISPGFDVRIG